MFILVTLDYVRERLEMVRLGLVRFGLVRFS